VLRGHASADAAHHRALLVVAEIGLGGRSDESQQISQDGVLNRVDWSRRLFARDGVGTRVFSDD